MRAQVRLAESGRSYHYSQLTNVLALMQQIRKNLRIEIEDQKIIMKSGQILKSNINFDTIQQKMKKTLKTSNIPLINQTNNLQTTQIQCLYVYNRKQLLKPIQPKKYQDSYYLRIFYEKCKQMESLTQNGSKQKQFSQKVNQKNIIQILQGLNKKIKLTTQNIIPRYKRFLVIISQGQSFKLEIEELLNFIQSQQKARKLLIRSIQYLLQTRTKKKYISVLNKIDSYQKKQNEQMFKESSSFFSSSKQLKDESILGQINNLKKQIEEKIVLFSSECKNKKKLIIKQMFKNEQKITFGINKNKSSLQRQFSQSQKLFEQFFEQFCEQVIKFNSISNKSKDKDNHQNIKYLQELDKRILELQKKVVQQIQYFTKMYLQLSKIHTRGQTEHIKTLYSVYGYLQKGVKDIDQDIKRLQKQFLKLKQSKSHEILISDFNSSKNTNYQYKKIVDSPKKCGKQIINFDNEQQSRSLRTTENKDKLSENSERKEKNINISQCLQNSLSILNNQSNKKIPQSHKHIGSQDGLIFANDQKFSKNQIGATNKYETSIGDSQQLKRRIQFNKRLKQINTYCSGLCQREQQLRRNFRNSKQFEAHQIDLLGKLNVPTLQIDYSETSDIELHHLYKKLMKQNAFDEEQKEQEKQKEQEGNQVWQKQLVQTANSVNKTLTTYLASKSNSTQRQRNVTKILSLLSQTFYKMMKIKVQKQTQNIRADIKQQLQIYYREKIQFLSKQNKQLIGKLQNKFQESENNSLQKGYAKKSDSLARFQQLQTKYTSLNALNQELQQQNNDLKDKIKNMQQKLLQYHEQMEGINNNLIAKLQQEEMEHLKQQLKIQKQSNLQLNAQVQKNQVQSQKYKTQFQKSKLNLYKQMKMNETLCKQIQQLSLQKQAYQHEFIQLKNILADKEVQIIKLQKQIESLNFASPQNFNQQSSKQEYQKLRTCECSQQIAHLQSERQILQEEIESLSRQLKEILYKQTEEVQTQTDCFNQQNSTFQKNDSLIQKQNMEINIQENHKETQKISENRSINAQNQIPTCNYFSQQAVSRYYVSSMTQQWMTSFPKFMPISVGKTIQQGMCHIFLPFSADLYVGVTVSQDKKNYTNYQQFIMEASQNSTEPVYILDLKQFNLRTNQMLRECSLVLIVRVEKKHQFSMSKKIMVSGKIQFALGFQDDEISIKNYSSFLQQ